MNFRKVFQYLLVLIPLGVLGNLIFTFMESDHSILLSLQSFSGGYLALAIVLGVLPWLTNAIRVKLWTKFIGRPLPLRDCFGIILGEELGSAITPTSAGGGYVKAGLLIHRKFSPGKALSLMTLGSLEDVVFFSLSVPTAFVLSSTWELFPVAFVVRQLQEHLLRVVFVIAAVLAGGILLQSRYQRLRRKLHAPEAKPPAIVSIVHKIKTAWRDFVAVYALIGRRGKILFLVTLMLTGVQWVCRFSVITALAASLHVPLDPLRFFFLQWLVFMAMAVTPTPGAAGGAEAAFYFVFAAALPENLLAVLTSAWRLFTFYFQLLLAALLFLGLERRAENSCSGGLETAAELTLSEA